MCLSFYGGAPAPGAPVVPTPLVFEMSSKEVARAINRLSREGLDLLGSSDGSALFDFVEEYFFEAT